jgi:hypothetical protein
MRVESVCTEGRSRLPGCAATKLSNCLCTNNIRISCSTQPWGGAIVTPKTWAERRVNHHRPAGRAHRSRKTGSSVRKTSILRLVRSSVFQLRDDVDYRPVAKEPLDTGHVLLLLPRQRGRLGVGEQPTPRWRLRSQRRCAPGRRWPAVTAVQICVKTGLQWPNDLWILRRNSRLMRPHARRTVLVTSGASRPISSSSWTVFPLHRTVAIAARRPPLYGPAGLVSAH